MPSHFSIILIMSQEQELLYKSFREDAIDTPLWRILWPTGFRADATFQDNLESVFPTAEMRMRAVDFFQGTRWNHTELPQDIQEVFEFLMLDYRGVSCFVNSSQVAHYVEQKSKECFELIAPHIDLSPLKNESCFSWSDPVAKANDLIDGWGETPLGADPVLYLIYDEYRRKSWEEEDIFDTWCFRNVCMVYFHGEEARIYTYEDADCTLLEVMLLDGDASFKKYSWSKHVNQDAMDFIDDLIDDNRFSVNDRKMHECQKAREMLLSERGNDVV